MNAIDFICLIPFYISMLLEGLEDVEIVGKAGKMIRFLKILRIFRVYKMFKHFAGLQSLLYTLQQAYKELGLLLHIVGMETLNLHFYGLPIWFHSCDAGVAILTFSSLMYICETEFAEVFCFETEPNNSPSDSSLAPVNNKTEDFRLIISLFFLF